MPQVAAQPDLSLIPTKFGRRTYYCPDFLMFGKVIDKLFSEILSTNMLRGYPDVNEPGLMYYLFSIAMLRIFRTCEPNPHMLNEILPAVETYEKVGLQHCHIPRCLEPFYKAIGHLDVTSLGRSFRPRLPQISHDDYAFNSYFYSPETAHVLPNFRTLLVKAYLFSKENGLAYNERTITAYRDISRLTNNALFQGIEIARQFDAAVPGTRDINSSVVSENMLTATHHALMYAYNTVLGRYLQQHVPLLSFISSTYSSLFDKFDCFTLEGIKS